MTNKALTVLAECADSRSGRRFSAGETFDPAPTRSQAKRLIAAGCLGPDAIDAATEDPLPTAPAAPVAAPPVQSQALDDGLFDLGKDELADIVFREQTPIDEDAIRAVVVASIRRHRDNVASGQAEAPASDVVTEPAKDVGTNDTGLTADNAASTAPAEPGATGDASDPDAQPQPAPENIEMRTEAGEAAAREADAAAREEQSQTAAEETGAPQAKRRGAR